MVENETASEMPLPHDKTTSVKQKTYSSMVEIDISSSSVRSTSIREFPLTTKRSTRSETDVWQGSRSEAAEGPRDRPETDERPKIRSRLTKLKQMLSPITKI